MSDAAASGSFCISRDGDGFVLLHFPTRIGDAAAASHILSQEAFAGTSSLGATTVLLAGIEDAVSLACQDTRTEETAGRNASAWQ